MANKFYITTSIPYTNAAPHIGFALEIVQADVLARYKRQRGDDVYFLTGTDEHGIKTARAAQALDKEPIEFANEISLKFSDLAKKLLATNDSFIRTTDEILHKPAVLKIWKKFEENGDIYKKNYKGLYCAGCEAFVPEKDLVDGKCPIHNKEPEVIEEENYFFRLTKYLPKIKNLIESGEYEIIPASRKNEILSIISQGIEDVSFSRVKEKYWGLEVPGDDKQNIYVWPDALSNYISGIGYASDSELFKKLWPADIHCIGKDIIEFHAIFWPAMLLSLGLEVPKKLFVHGFITVANKKMSKSVGNVIDPFELIEKYGVDGVRYYLLREIPPTEDGDFTIEKFEKRYNSDLASGLGNLVSRVRVMAEGKEINGVAGEDIKKQIEITKEQYEKALSIFDFSEALQVVWKLISYCDKYINETKPWENKEGSLRVINDLLFAISVISNLIYPFLPDTASKIEQIIATENQKLKNPKSTPLFPRLM
jgi:methionyl-tRNA synthetase